MTQMPLCIKATYQEGPAKDDCALKAKIAMESLAAYPEDAEYLHAYVVVFLQIANEYDASIAYGQKAFPLLTINECRTEVLGSMAHAYEATSQWDALVEVRKQLLEETGAAYHPMRELAEAYGKAGDIDGAISCYKRMIETMKDGCETEIFTKLASLYYDDFQYENASRNFQLAAQRQSHDSAWLWFNTGATLAMTRKLEEAAFYFQMVLKIDPNYTDAHYSLGRIYQGKGDVYMALHHYMEILKIKPDSPQVYNSLASISFDENGDIGEAIRNIEIAVAMNTEPKLLILLYRNLANLYAKLSDYDKQTYYTAKMMEAIGFPVEYDKDDEKGEDAL